MKKIMSKKMKMNKQEYTLPWQPRTTVKSEKLIKTNRKKSTKQRIKKSRN
jgi:hypothetical protein